MFKKLIKILLLSLLVAVSVDIQAQQEPQFTQNMFNYMFVNPGYAGMRDGICASGIVRQQWVGLNNDMEGNSIAPETFVMSVDAPIDILHGGVGLSIQRDKLAYSSNVGVKLGYSYHATLGMGDLGIGAQFGFVNKTIDFGRFNPTDSSDPVIEGRTGEEQDMMFDLAFGLFYDVPDQYYLGLSSTRLMQNSGANTRFNLKRHYFLVGGYHYQITPVYELTPSFMVKYDGAVAQFDIGGIVEYEKKYWGGVNYRVQDAVSVMIGLYLKDLKFGYAYDITTSRLSGAGSGGSHELMLSYCFKIEVEKNNNSYRNIRFL